jgi:hypothetical protein
MRKPFTVFEKNGTTTRKMEDRHGVRTMARFLDTIRQNRRATIVLNCRSSGDHVTLVACSRSTVQAPSPQAAAMEKIRVLFLAASPGVAPLSLDEEHRQIMDKIRAADYRDSIEVVSRWAVRRDDLQQALLETKPHVLHFSGHGTESDEWAGWLGRSRLGLAAGTA